MTIQDKQNKEFLSIVRALLSENSDGSCSIALLHNAGDISSAIRSDVDLAFSEHPNQRFTTQLKRLCAEHDMRIVQSLHYEVPYGYYYIIASKTVPPQFLHLDCIYDPWGINRYYLRSTDLVETAKWSADSALCAIAESNQLLYLAIKRCVKGSINNEKKQTLRDLFKVTPECDRAELTTWFGTHGAGQIELMANADSIEDSNIRLKSLQRLLRARFIIQHPGRWLAHHLFDLARKTKRLLRPTGFFIVILGPDGSGKSTVTKELRRQLRRGFRNTFQFHWRPHLLPKLRRAQTSSAGADVDTAPNTVSKYRGITSLARFFYYWLDFLLGYWLRIYPMKAQTTFIIGERYFPDILVHPERYGFTVPKPIMRMASLLIAKPDLIVLLKDDPQVIFTRKAELSVEEIKHQISEYQREIVYWGQFIEINTDACPEVIASRIAEHVLNLCEERLERRKLNA